MIATVMERIERKRAVERARKAPRKAGTVMRERKALRRRIGEEQSKEGGLNDRHSSGSINRKEMDAGS